MSVEGSTLDVGRSAPRGAVFLSYASQDAEAAKKICDALRAAGVEVWFDQSELVGGDAWDAKIRRQIGTCALLIPVISANTQARREGYFRLEWRLAVERMRQMDDDLPFLLPVVVDATRDTEAFVPDRFREVQWTRAPNGETSPAFAQRVKELLGGETENRGQGTEDKGPQADDRIQKAGNGRRRRPNWLAPVIGGAVVALLAVVISRPWEKAAHAMTPPSMSTANAPVSPARQLAVRARAMIFLPDPTRETLDTAVQLIEQAKALDPADAEVWAIGAEADAWMVFYTFDTSEARRERARSGSSRALSLDPTSHEVRLARAFVLITVVNQSAVRPEAEALLRALLKENPDDRDALGFLAQLLRDSGQFGEAADKFKRAESFNAAGWAYFFAGRYDEAAAMVEQGLRTDHSVANLTLKAAIATFGREDLDAAQAAIDQLPASALLEDRSAVTAVRLRLMRREPEKALDILRALPREWLSSAAFVGPKAIFTGAAHAMANRPEAAQVDRRAALQQIEQRLAVQGNASRLLLMKAALLALLGDKAEAGRLLDLALQLSVPGALDGDQLLAKTVVSLLVGRREAAIDEMEAALKSPDRLPFLHGLVRYDPDFASLREDPRIDKVLRETLPKGAKPFEDQKTDDREQRTAQAVDQKSVAVLAFANLSDDKANEYFSDGISEELLNVLSKIPDLKVSARTSSFHFKGKDTPIPEIAQQLGVAYVVEGSVRKAGDKVRITAQLIKAADGFHVWSETFTRDLKDIFAVQDEIAGLIAQNLSVKLAGTGNATREVNPEAHRLVLEGRHFWNLRTADGFDRAEAAFRRAIALDPEYAAAYSGLANTLGTRLGYRAYEGEIDMSYEASRAAAARAVELDPTDAQVYPALGLALTNEGHYAEAKEVYQKALRLNPNYALSHHWLSLVLELEGRIDEALVEINRAVELDPLSGIAVGTQARMLMEAGRYAEAFATFERAVAILPDRPTHGSFRAVCLFKMNRRDEAVESARKAAASPSQELRLAADADAIFVLRQTGHEAEAAAHAERAQTFLNPQSYQRGAVLAAMGRLDEALPYLERTPPAVKYVFSWSPVWDAWRDDSRFIRLLEKLGCAQDYRRARETLSRLQAASKGGK